MRPTLMMVALVATVLVGCVGAIEKKKFILEKLNANANKDLEEAEDNEVDTGGHHGLQKTKDLKKGLKDLEERQASYALADRDDVSLQHLDQLNTTNLKGGDKVSRVERRRQRKHRRQLKKKLRKNRRKKKFGKKKLRLQRLLKKRQRKEKMNSLRKNKKNKGNRKKKNILDINEKDNKFKP